MTEGTFQHCNDLWNASEQIVEGKFEPITPLIWRVGGEGGLVEGGGGGFVEEGGGRGDWEQECEHSLQTIAAPAAYQHHSAEKARAAQNPSSIIWTEAKPLFSQL